MRIKVTEVCGEIFVNDELFHTCTTTLSELKEMWDNAKILNECNRVYPLLDNTIFNNPILHDRKVMFYTLKNTPRKFTIEQVCDIASQCYINEEQVLNHLTKLPPNGIEVEIEGNKIVKVYGLLQC